MKINILFYIFLTFTPFFAEASPSEVVNFAHFSLLWSLPFVGMILSIAIFPLVAGHFWHHHYGKVSLFWALLFLIPFISETSLHASFELISETILFEYLPFIILLFGLFTISGGVRLKGTLQGKPLLNSCFLISGTCIASLMGTTGAAMLLIRPLIRANESRKYQAHIYVFFIFLVANIGGSLSPLGDPPLFLGFLKGVHFFWPLTHLWPHMLFVSSIVLFLFIAIESYLYRKEPHKRFPHHSDEAFGIDGKFNILLILLVAVMVLLNGIWKPNMSYLFLGHQLPLELLVSNGGILFLTFTSIFLTKDETRKLNGFTWFPIIEVAKLFFAIFMTIIPVLGILKLGEEGSLSSVVRLVSDSNGQPIPQMYYWITGILSSFLDNAPTYLVFFNAASGNAEQLMTDFSTILIAISTGAVFMGAMTYIGNAPNFMVCAIVEENKIAMPNFFAYMLWSCAILLPTFILMNFIFF